MCRSFHTQATVVFALVLWSIVYTPLASQVPQKLHFQGILTTTGGVTVPDGQYQLTFRLYTSATAGSPVWTETQNVTVSSGIFSVELGAVTPLNLSFDQPYYLGITVGSGSEMAPRIPLLGSPYSFYAQQAGSAAVGGDLAGSSTSATVVAIQGRPVSATAPSAGQVLQWDGSAWVPGSVSSGGGSGWSTSGNVLSGTEFLGSVNAQPVVIKSAGSEAMRIDVDQQVGIGVTTPTNRLHVQANSNPLRLEGLGMLSNAATVLVVDTDGVVYTTSASALVSSSGWGLAGNSGTNPASDFLGTTDNQPLVIKVNNQQAMRIEPGVSPNLLGGYGSNSISSGVVGAVIGGGGNSVSVNAVTDNYGVVGGGVGNQAGNNSGTTTDAQYATVGGGYDNTASGNYSTVGGGSGNIASGNYNTVSGGKSNTVNGLNSTVGGGIFNTANGHSATVGGGLDNEATGWYSTVGGGANNTASGTGSAVGGGTINTASGTAAAVSGGSGNTAAGDYSWAGGRSMYLATSASHTFVWGYATSTTAITVSDAFLIGPYGNTYKVGINTASPGYALELPNNTSQTIGKARANAWMTYSDARVKSHITGISGAEALAKIAALRPVYYLHHSSRWTPAGKLERLEEGEYRYGFIAQELMKILPEAVYVPEDTTKDLYGVNYSELIPILTAALQAQQRIIEQQRLVTEQQQTEIQQQRQEIVQLRQQVAALQQGAKQSKETQAEVAMLRQLVLQLQQQLEQLQSNAAVGQQSSRK